MRNLYVDRLRGFAALAVVLSHASGYIPLFLYGLPTPLRYAISANGFNGVSIFFTVSGFLIANKLISSSDKSGRFPIGVFYLHRVARIAPCLILMVACGCLAAIIGPPRFAVDWSGMSDRLLYIFTFRYNIYFTSLPKAPRLWDPLWSLSVEEVFYLCFPVTLLLTKNRKLLTAFLIVIIVVGPVWRSSTDDPYSYFSNFDEIAMGVLAAFFLDSAKGDLRISGGVLKCLRYLGFIIIAANFLSTRSVYGGPDASLTWGPTLMGLGSAIYLLGTMRSDAPRSFAFLWLEKFGEFSYEIYLFHMFLLIALAGTFELPLPLISDPIHIGLGTVWTAAVIGILLLGSHLIYRYFSEPANRLIRRISGLRAAPTAVS
jgi:peptidoglycan/LPS O-acetylase OafA/YrhL